MKLVTIFILSVLSTIVKGAWIAAVAQPVLLSLGTIFTALNYDVNEIQPIEWKNFVPFVKRKKKKKCGSEISLEEFKTLDADFEIIKPKVETV